MAPRAGGIPAGRAGARCGRGEATGWRSRRCARARCERRGRPPRRSATSASRRPPRARLVRCRSRERGSDPITLGGQASGADRRCGRARDLSRCADGRFLRRPARRRGRHSTGGGRGTCGASSGVSGACGGSASRRSRGPDHRGCGGRTVATSPFAVTERRGSHPMLPLTIFQPAQFAPPAEGRACSARASFGSGGSLSPSEREIAPPTGSERRSGRAGLRLGPGHHPLARPSALTPGPQPPPGRRWAPPWNR